MAIVKQEFNEQGKITYYEYDDGKWGKYLYDTNGNETYFEDSEGMKKIINE